MLCQTFRRIWQLACTIFVICDMMHYNFFCLGSLIPNNQQEDEAYDDEISAAAAAAAATGEV